MRTTNISPPDDEIKPKPYIPRKSELLERHREFIEAATDLLHLMRETEDGSCVACGAERGKQHVRGYTCMNLVLWRHRAQYGEVRDDQS